MAKQDASKKRNFVLLSHAQAGKTTLSEAVLFKTGATTRRGSVAEGNTISDYSPDEIERRSSVNASVLTCNFKGHQIQFIDTPGYMDFLGEVISCLHAADNAVLIVDAVNGIEVSTEMVWELLEEANVPRIIFINKLDKENADLNKCIKDIRENLSKKCLPINEPFDKALVEAVAETQDALLEKYLEGKEFTEDEIRQALRGAIIQGKVYPILSGSAINDQGVDKLLEAIINYLASPLERQPLKGLDPVAKKEKILKPASDGPLAGFVFKTIYDAYVGQLTVFRVFSGKLSSNTEFYNTNKEVKERIGQLYFLFGKEQRPVDEVSCGDIAALAKLKDTSTSDTMTDNSKTILFNPIIFPQTVISASIKPKSRQDEEKISQSLSKLAIEDPTFLVNRDPQTKEQLVSGMGDLHLEIMVGRMRKRFGVEVELGTPKVAYKETIKKTTRVQGKYKKQSGGRGQYGDVWLEIEPLSKDSEFEFVDKIFGGAIPRNFIPSVEKGVRNACIQGVVAGYPLVNLKVTLVDGSYHDVDSSDIAFQIAGRMALRKAVFEAGPVLLEPIMDVDVIVSEDYMGPISGDINSRRGRIMGMDVKGKLQVLKAQVPLSEMFKYANDLRSITGGRGMYTMKFSHYEEIPAKISATIIAQSKKDQKEEDLE
ncbi:MAG: elongation factor G [Candidatus Omnitrophota bacterium]